ncbi:CHAT domain-containing protein [Boletus edulis BED1]|uniref:CHAT domain-containing protein n=1 Tax=Boletus edulis BED1 TaxID=1328754 RepID=A0AAD4G9F7_BOLED|nr:CHAT domain-containing protein [Boletus edulis BED1]
MTSRLSAGEQLLLRESMTVGASFGLLRKRVQTSMHFRPGTGEERPHHELSRLTWASLGLTWKRVWSSMQYRSGTGEEQLQHEPSSSPHCTLIDGIHTPSVSNPDPQYGGQVGGDEEQPGPDDQPQDGPLSSDSAQEQGKEKESGHGDNPQDEPSFPGSVQEQGEEGNPAPGDQPQGWSSSSSSSVTDMGEDEEIVIMDIRVEEPALGLRRLPAGFYTVVHHSGHEWRTENKRSSMSNNVVEWSGPIPLPSDLKATICLEVYAYFEFQPTLGTGEHLRKLIITVDQLLDRSARRIPITFFPKNGDIVSPCSSISVTVEQRKYKSGNLSSRVLGTLCSTTGALNELEDATNYGHSALSRYRKHGEKRDLEHSIAEFERALNNCPLDHPCRAAAQSNLAMAKLVLCQVNGMIASLETPIRLYRDALTPRPVGHADRPSTLIQLAALHLARFEKQRDDVDGAQVEALLHEASELSSTDSHENRAVSFMLQLYAGHRVGPDHASGQSSVDSHSSSRVTDEDPQISSVQLLERFERYGDLADLQRAITLLQELVRSVEVWDVRYCVGLGNLGVALLLRFKHVGELSDLEDAMSTHRDAVHLTPDGHPDKLSCLNNLGISFVTRFERLGELRDLEDAISTHRDAVHLTPDGHPEKPSCLNNLGISFITRFERLGELRDLEDAILTHRDAVHLTPDDHPDKPSRLTNLGNSFVTRFERLGELRDLEDAISTHRDAVHLTPDDHPDKPSRLTNLGNSFITRFLRLRELRDLEDAISTHKEAVHLTPDGHPDKPSRLNNLGISFRARFEHLGKLSDLEDAISTLREAVHLTPDGHPDKPSRLNNLGISFRARFERLEELSDLQDAISTLGDAADLIPHGHPHKPSILNNLGISFITRFECHGELSDLEHAISTHMGAIDLTPDGHPNKPSRLTNLGISFITRFERLGVVRDLENAISTLRNAADLTPDGHSHKPGMLNNLGISFITHFKCLGELRDLKVAISTLREAIDLTPDGHPDKPSRLNNLGISLITHFERLGELRDLEHAISAQREAADLTPDGHPDKPSRLNNLGISLITHFERLGELRDLEHAISAQREAADLTPDGHPDKPSRLTNLGSSFVTRFERLGELRDLEDAISTHRDAVVLTPHGHPDKPSRLTNLGISFVTRFEHLGELRDLEDAISTHREAADLTPDGHPHKPSGLNNLGLSFITRFERLGELSDLEDAISTYGDAVHLTPDGHPDKPSCLNNLGISFRARFERLGKPSDLEHAISTLINAVVLTPNDHSHKPGMLNNLGNSFQARFERLGESSDLENAISLYSHSASVPIGPISVRFRASRNWVSCARRMRHPSLLHAYSIAINLFPQLAWIGLSSTHRYAELKRGADIVREAAAAALDSAFPELAVEWLEQGRSIIWGVLLQLRNSYEELSSAHPDHTRRLRELSAALDNACATREQSLFTFSESIDDAMHRTTWTLQQDADRRRTLAIERDKLLREIRHLLGFERFLLPKDFPQLRASAHSGPVVMLNAAETRCDALILLADVDHVIHVPLPNFNFQRSVGLQNMLGTLLGHARATPFDDRKGRPATWSAGSWETLLATLFNGVIKPVLDALAFSVRATVGDLSRIFWCPTGPFVSLPIHAAGLYGTQYSSPGNKVSDFVVSSYVPTLSILAQSNCHVAHSNDLRLLLVGQPPSYGQDPLRGVVPELGHIRTVVGTSACTTLLESSVGTVEEVLGLMKDADWVHFVCHGIQDAAKPSESGLCLAYGRRLKISDIIGLSRSRGGLAFLSACQTAMGDEGLTNEAIHIAAGMLFAGYGGVIGTMWSINDRLAPVVARNTYQYLFRNGARPDYRDAARALHEAVERLRESGEASFVTWLPFIHVGL